MDYADEAVKIGLEVIDEMILKVTPDAIIEMTDELVELLFVVTNIGGATEAVTAYNLGIRAIAQT